MNRQIKLSAALTVALLIFAGCSASTGQIVDPNSYKGQKRCAKLSKDLIKVDQYIEMVDNTDAFHLEEAAEAIENPDISTSTNKKQMLKDANALRASLDNEYKKLGCK
jgi:hypothetical protein